MVVATRRGGTHHPTRSDVRRSGPPQVFSQNSPGRRCPAAPCERAGSLLMAVLRVRDDDHVVRRSCRVGNTGYCREAAPERLSVPDSPSYGLAGRCPWMAWLRTPGEERHDEDEDGEKGEKGDEEVDGPRGGAARSGCGGTGGKRSGRAGRGRCGAGKDRAGREAAADDCRVDSACSIRGDGHAAHLKIGGGGADAGLSQPLVDLVHRRAGIVRDVRTVEEEDARVAGPRIGPVGLRCGRRCECRLGMLAHGLPCAGGGHGAEA